MPSTPVLLLLIAAGGALGAMARYILSEWVLQRLGPAFPWGTLTVNMLGSFLLGLLLPVLVLDGGRPEARALLTVGFLGAFTTFSTFAYEATMLVQHGRHARAWTYVVVSLLLGLGSLAGGLMVASVFA